MINKYTQPNWEHSILITIDTQKDFALPGASAEVRGTVEILARMKKLLEAYRIQGLPVIHVVRLYAENGSNVDLCRREAVEKGLKIVAPYSEGAELVSEIRPEGYDRIDAKKLLNGGFQLVGPKEWIMYKSRWGAFYKTNLESFIRDRNIDTLVLSGCNFPNCPRASMFEASERDFRVVMVLDAMSQTYDRGIQEMRNIGVQVCESTDVLTMVNKAGNECRQKETK